MDNKPGLTGATERDHLISVADVHDLLHSDLAHQLPDDQGAWTDEEERRNELGAFDEFLQEWNVPACSDIELVEKSFNDVARGCREAKIELTAITGSFPDADGRWRSNKTSLKTELDWLRCTYEDLQLGYDRRQKAPTVQ